MSLVANRSLARNSNPDPLPLFDWAERNRPIIFEQLRITRKLAGRVRISASVLNVMAEAHGFIGREASPHG
jgi:hypothetical protein